MEREYNYQAFTPEEVEQGLFQDLLDYLVDHNLKNEHQFYDIHITSDGYCTIVEWKDIGYEYQHEEGCFKYVPSNGYVMLEYHFPDNHYEMFESEEEYQEALKLWLEENPGWVKTPYGTWTNLEENRYHHLTNLDKELDAPENVSIEINSIPPIGISAKDHNTSIVQYILHSGDAEKVIHRTDYIAVGFNLEDLFDNNDLIESNRINTPEDPDVTYKLGYIHLRLDRQKFDKDEDTQYFDSKIAVYYSSEIGVNDVMFFTDSPCMIYKAFVKDVGNPFSRDFKDMDKDESDEKE